MGRLDGRWWIVVAFSLFYSVAYALLYFVAATTFDSNTASAITLAGMIGGIFLFIGGVYGLIKDREYVEAVSGWSPSPAYFLMFAVPIIGHFLAVLYLYRRHQYVGTP